MYLQASGSYTLDQLFSPADNLVPDRIQVSKNDYYTASGTIGFALTPKMDLTATYSYYLADNYNPGIFLTGLPLGASLEQHTVGASVVYRFSKRMQLTTRYAYLTSSDESSGGNNDFQAHLVSSTLRFRF
jgi:predicted porin